MGYFETKGYAKREYVCDIMEITVYFHASDDHTYEISRNVMDECERFLKDAQKIGLKPEDINLAEDVVLRRNSYDKTSRNAERELSIRTKYDMKLINAIKSILNEGKYAHSITVSMDYSGKEKLHKELLYEAMADAKEKAEELAKGLGTKIVGIEYAQDNSCYDDKYLWENLLQCLSLGDDADDTYEESNKLSAKASSESASITIKWNIE